MSTISFNPSQTTSPQSTFAVQTGGYTQGTFQDDPTTRLWLLSGTVASATNVPVYGGIALTESVPTTNSQTGASLGVASTTSGINAWAVFNQGYNGIITPGNSVPQYTANGTLNYFRTGSNARIAVKADASVSAFVAGSSTATGLFWDTVLQILTATSGANTVAFTGRIISLNSTSKIILNTAGVLTWTTGLAAMIQI